MANLREYLQLWLDFYLQVFHRFFWSASDIKDREKKAVFITGAFLLCEGVCLIDLHIYCPVTRM